MGMLVEGINLIRDFWSVLNDKNSLGSGDTQETGQDSGLETPIGISSTLITTIATENQYLTKEALHYAYYGTGDNVSETVWETQSNSVGSSRVTVEPIAYNTASDISIKTRWYIKGRAE